MLTFHKSQSHTPPVHMLYDGFDVIGKNLAAFGETMGKIPDQAWKGSAKRRADARDYQIPDPVPPVPLIEQSFSTLHKTFDVFESFMESQRRSKGEAAVEILDTAKVTEKVDLEDQEPAKKIVAQEKESYPGEKGANTTAKAVSAQGNEMHTVEKPLEGKNSRRHSTAKGDVQTKGNQGTMETSAPAPLVDARDSQPMLTPGPPRKRASGNDDSSGNDMLPPAKRRAVFRQELHSPGAAPILPRLELVSPWTPVRSQSSEGPRHKISDHHHPSGNPEVARTDTEQN